MSEIINKIAKERYLRGDEKTIEDVYDRVAYAVGRNINSKLCPACKTVDDSWAMRFYSLMKNGIFLPNSPTLMNAGTDNQMLSACFALPVNDSFFETGGIMDGVNNSVRIMKMGGGVGYNFSHLRPAGSVVKSTDGVASGPVSFMKFYNSAIDVVKQGGRRRGAAIGILNINHPDIEEFIDCKDTEGDYTNFNLSVMLDNKFMNDVCAEDLFEYHGNTVERVKKNKALFTKIVKHIHKNGEPGVLFYDNINKDNPNEHLYNINTTNPCVIGDTLLLTDKGYVPIKDVVDIEVNAWNGFEWSTIIPMITGYNQELMEIGFSDGTSLICTPYHGFKTWVGYEVDKEARQLVVGDKLAKCNYPIIEGEKELEHAYTHGFFSGDGHYDNYHKCNAIWLYGKKKELAKYINYVHINTNADNRTYVKLDNSVGYIKEFVPTAEYTIESRLQWLAGIIDSDGSENSKDGTVSISSIDKQFLLDIKLMLNTLGCNGTVSLMKKATIKLMPDGKGGEKEYTTKDCYRITISATHINDLKQIGLVTYRVSVNGTPNRMASRFVTIKLIKHLNYTDTVYCATEPKNHTLIFNGVYSLNCGEIPIGVNPETGGGEACNLGSINLVKFYNPAFNHSVDWNKLHDVIRDAVVFLDTIIDMNEYPTQAIADMTRSTRKIGLGFMGLHDLLIMSGISYASEEGRIIAEDIMDFIRTVAIGASVELAKHSGVYDEYEGSKWDKKNIEVRNSTLTCIAPTGTLSILANCSSGIEPYFNWVYERKNTVGSTFKIVVPLFEEAMKNFIKDCSDFEVKAILYNNFGVVTYDMQDKYVDNNNRWVMEDGNAAQFEGDIRDKMYDCICEECFSAGTIQHLDFIPKEMRRVFMNAGDISWQDHVKMQIALQKHCDNSISKTINMPNSATEQEIADAIIMAWKGGCKGLTLYRDGSREKVVMSNKTEWSDASSAIESIEIDIVPRGEEHQNTHVLPSSTFDVCTGCGDMYIHVAEMNGKPRKVFINNAGNGGCEANTAAIGRLISLGLKHNVPIREIIKQLRKVKCNSCLNNKKAEGKSCADIIGKTLEECIPDEEVKVMIKPSVKLSGTITADYVNKNLEHICYNCQSTMIPEGNCWVCINCGHSKCG